MISNRDELKKYIGKGFVWLATSDMDDGPMEELSEFFGVEVVNVIRIETNTKSIDWLIETKGMLNPMRRLQLINDAKWVEDYIDNDFPKWG